MKKNTNLNWKGLAAIVLMAGVGLAVGYGIGKWVKNNDTTGDAGTLAPEGALEWVLFLLILGFSAWVVIAIHELGHLVAGLAQGFRFGLYIAGPLGFRNEAGRPVAFWNRDNRSFGGIAATLPRRFQDPLLTRKFAWVVAAGPLTSLLWTFIGLGLNGWFGSADPLPLWAKGLAWFGLISGLGSLFIFVATAFPVRSSGGFMSDGARLLSLLRGGPGSELEQLTLSMAGLLSEGRSYGEFPPEVIQRLNIPQARSVSELGAWATSLQYHMEREEPVAAADFARRLAAGLADSPPFVRYVYGRDLAFYYAFIEKNKTEAHAWWGDVAGYGEKMPDATFIRIKAALALLDGDPAEARRLEADARKRLPGLMLQGLKRAESLWLDRLAAAIQNAEKQLP